MGLIRQTTLAAVLLSAATSGYQASVSESLGAREATLVLRDADDLQDVLNRAEPGQTIVLEPGRTYNGPFFLPRKTGDGWITIRGDRKSTRLNSSHSSISYAVFCLKKKRQRITP